MSDRTAADPNELARLGGDFNRVAGEIAGIKRDLEAAVSENGQTGTGEMARALTENYRPGEEVALEFLDLFNQLFVEKGNRLLETGRVFTDVDNSATDRVSRPDSGEE
jgi:hypothetical protein